MDINFKQPRHPELINNYFSDDLIMAIVPTRSSGKSLFNLVTNKEYNLHGFADPANFDLTNQLGGKANSCLAENALGYQINDFTGTSIKSVIAVFTMGEDSGYSRGAVLSCDTDKWLGFNDDGFLVITAWNGSLTFTANESSLIWANYKFPHACGYIVRASDHRLYQNGVYLGNDTSSVSFTSTAVSAMGVGVLGYNTRGLNLFGLFVWNKYFNDDEMKFLTTYPFHLVRERSSKIYSYISSTASPIVSTPEKTFLSFML